MCKHTEKTHDGQRMSKEYEPGLVSVIIPTYNRADLVGRAESISLYNLLTFPFWMLLQFIKKPVSEAYFTLVSEISWRAGLLWGFLK